MWPMYTLPLHRVLSIEYPKTKFEVITLASEKGRGQSKEPIKTPIKYM